MMPNRASEFDHDDARFDLVRMAEGRLNIRDQGELIGRIVDDAEIAAAVPSSRLISIISSSCATICAFAPPISARAM